MLIYHQVFQLLYQFISIDAFQSVALVRFHSEPDYASGTGGALKNKNKYYNGNPEKKRTESKNPFFPDNIRR